MEKQHYEFLLRAGDYERWFFTHFAAMAERAYLKARMPDLTVEIYHLVFTD